MAETFSDNPHTQYSLQTPNVLVGLRGEGGYVTDWKVKNPETGQMVPILYVHPENLKRTGIPPLVPNYGPSTVLGQHGFGRLSEWKLVPLSDSAAIMLLSHHNISEEAKGKYPYKFQVQIMVEITSLASIRYQMMIKNDDKYPMKILPGIHPYFAVDQDQRKDVTVLGVPKYDPKDETKFNWIDKFPDNEYPYQSKKITVVMPDREIDITKLNSNSKVDRVTIWSEAGLSALCVEPISGRPNRNTFDGHALTLAPEHVWLMDLEMTTRFKKPSIKG